MELALRQVGPNLVVSFVGRVNLEGPESLAFKERLKALIGDGHTRVVMDLGNVGFLEVGEEHEAVTAFVLDVQVREREAVELSDSGEQLGTKLKLGFLHLD